MNTKQFYTPDEFAELLGTTGASIRNLLREGELIGTKLGRKWQIPATELIRLTKNNEILEEINLPLNKKEHETKFKSKSNTNTVLTPELTKKILSHMKNVMQRMSESQKNMESNVSTLDMELENVKKFQNKMVQEIKDTNEALNIISELLQNKVLPLLNDFSEEDGELEEEEEEEEDSENYFDEQGEQYLIEQLSKSENKKSSMKANKSIPGKRKKRSTFMLKNPKKRETYFQNIKQSKRSTITQDQD